MIEQAVINGQHAHVAYLSGEMQAATKEDHVYVKILFANGDAVIARRADSPVEKYSPEEPRVPKGQGGGGRWTHEGYSDRGGRTDRTRRDAEMSRLKSPDVEEHLTPKQNEDLHHYFDFARTLRHGKATFNERKIYATKQFIHDYPEFKGRENFVFDVLLPSEPVPPGAHTLKRDEVEKYSPDQPRVPKGSGRISGEWTGGGADETGTTPSGAFHISDHDKKDIRDMIARGATPSEIDAHPAIRAAQEYQRKLGATSDEPGYGTPRWRAERQFEGGIRSYNAAVDDLMHRAGKFSNGPVLHNREATIILGPPASGKSAFAEQIAGVRRAALVDPDDAKKLFTEFRGGIGANAVHEESALLSAAVLNRFAAYGANLVLPKVGGGVASIQQLTDALKAAGYKINLVNMEVSEDRAYSRAIGRFLNTGRLISKDYTVAVDGNPTKTFNTLAATGQYAQTVSIDNNHPIGHHVVTQGKDTEIGRAVGGA